MLAGRTKSLIVHTTDFGVLRCQEGSCHEPDTTTNARGSGIGKFSNREDPVFPSRKTPLEKSSSWMMFTRRYAFVAFSRIQKLADKFVLGAVSRGHRGTPRSPRDLSGLLPPTYTPDLCNTLTHPNLVALFVAKRRSDVNSRFRGH